MANKKSKEKQLEAVQTQFSDWRKNRKGRRDRIPESLWDAAASLSDSFSVNELSKTLRLNHSSLKERVETTQLDPSEETCRATFIEFPPLNPPTDSTEVSLELEKAGATMKVHAKGRIDVASLVQTFWRQQS